MTEPSSFGADRMDLLHSFIRIVQSGSLSAAAQQLGTSQPTMSRRLKALEQLLGVRLLQRSTHGMQLTEEGQRCFERAQELVADWHALEADLRGPAEHPRGNLRVLVPHAYGQEQLVQALMELLKSYLDLNVEWILGDHEPNFTAEGIDCAVRVGPVSDLSVVALRVAEVERIVVASPQLVPGGTASLSSPAQLEQLPWLAISTFYRREVELQRVDDDSIRHRLEFTPRFTTTNLYAIRSAARGGLGVAVVSAWVTNDDLRTGRLVRLLPEWEAAPLPMSIIYPYASVYSARLRFFVDTMRKAIPLMPGMRRGV